VAAVAGGRDVNGLAALDLKWAATVPMCGVPVAASGDAAGLGVKAEAW
jgi:hypothetical protein